MLTVLCGAVGGGVVYDFVPFVGGRAGNDGDEWPITGVEDFVGDAGLDVDEVPRFVGDGVDEVGAVVVADLPFEDEEHHFEAVVDVGVGDAADWDGGDVH